MTLLTVRVKEISRKEDTPCRGAEPASFGGSKILGYFCYQNCPKPSLRGVRPMQN